MMKITKVEGKSVKTAKESQITLHFSPTKVRELFEKGFEDMKKDYEAGKMSKSVFLLNQDILTILKIAEKNLHNGQ